MSDEFASTPDPELTEVEAALGSLVPSKGRIDRDRIMFRAGQLSVRQASASRRAWALAACLALVASGEGVMLARRPPPEVIERVVIVQEPARALVTPDLRPVPISEPRLPDYLVGPTAHERLADQVFRYGLDGLPRSIAITTDDPKPELTSARRQLQEEMRRDLLIGDPS